MTRTSRAGNNAPRCRPGLTLVELIVVLSVMVLASLVVVPGFVRFHHASQFNWAVRRTLALAGEARGLAVSGDRVVMLEYDPGSHGLRLLGEAQDTEGDGGGGTLAPLDERRTPDTRLLPYPLDVEVSIENDRAPGGDEGQSLRFFPDGRAEPARVRFTREGFEPVELAVNPRTGRLKIVTLDGERP
ncbi:MAG TPA: prepilin-type N-terminal cleavage/methylation domain-containing protein [Armatimonadota bacterium]|nr:prepilin-type N-terminal cleavage/methylation domain-containing protein [Armatimonadota bacterium]